MSGDYPAGAENDSNAPYNNEDCFDCDGHGTTCTTTGFNICDCEEGCSFEACFNCGGTGRLSEQSDRDAYESFIEDTTEDT